MLLFLLFATCFSIRIAVNGFIPSIFQSMYSHFSLEQTTEKKEKADIYLVESSHYDDVPENMLEICSFQEKLPDFDLFYRKKKLKPVVFVSPNLNFADTLSSIIFSHDITISPNINNATYLILPKGDNTPKGFKRQSIDKSKLSFLEYATTEFFIFSNSSIRNSKITEKLCFPIYQPSAKFFALMIIILLGLIYFLVSYSPIHTLKTPHKFWIFDKNMNLLDGESFDNFDKLTQLYIKRISKFSYEKKCYTTMIIRFRRKEETFCFDRLISIPIFNSFIITLLWNETFPIYSELQFDCTVKTKGELINAKPEIKLSSYSDYRPIHLTFTLENNIRYAVDLPTSALAPFQPYGQLFTLVFAIFYHYHDLFAKGPYTKNNYKDMLTFSCERLITSYCFFFYNNELKFKYIKDGLNPLSLDEINSIKDKLHDETYFAFDNTIFSNSNCQISKTDTCFVHRMKSKVHDYVLIIAYQVQSDEPLFHSHILPFISVMINFLYQISHIEKRYLIYDAFVKTMCSFHNFTFIEIAVNKRDIIEFNTRIIPENPKKMDDLLDILKQYNIDDFDSLINECRQVIKGEKKLSHRPLTLFINNHQRYFELTATSSFDSTLQDSIISIIVEDVTYVHDQEIELSSCLPEIKKTVHSLALGSFSIKNNDIVMESDDIFHALNMPPNDRTIKQLIPKNELSSYDSILKGEKAIFKLLGSDGQTISVSAFSDGETGFLVDSLSFVGLKSNSNPDDALHLASANANAIFWSIDTRTDEVKPLFKQPTIWDILSVEKDQKFARIVDYLHTEDRDEFLSALNDIINNKTKQITVDARVQKIGGAYEYHKFIITKSNKYILNCVAININKQKEMEYKLQDTSQLRDMLLSSQRLALWTFKTDENEKDITSFCCSNSSSDLTKSPKQKQTFEEMVKTGIIMNWNNVDIIHPEYRDDFVERIRKAFLNFGSIEIDLPIILDDGEKWVSFRGRFKPSTKNIVGVCIDMSEIRSALKELEIEKKHAEEANRQKTMFLANMSHEIRTPMNGIFGMLDVLATKELTTEQRLYVDSIRSSTFQLKKLIDDTFKFTKIEQGEIESNPCIFSLYKEFDPICISTALRSIQNKVKFNVSFSKRMPLTMYGEMQLFMQIINNIISNSIKFTKQGSINVKFDWEVNDPNSGNDNKFTFLFNNKSQQSSDNSPTEICVFEVVDTGIGISRDQQRFIFDRFFQANQSVARFFGGSGLGLALVYDIINFMKGTIDFQSEVGKGTKVKCRIPMSSTMCPHYPKFNDGKTHTLIFMIEDKEITEYLEDQMKFYHYETIQISNPDDIIEMVKNYEKANNIIDSIFVEGNQNMWPRLKHVLNRIPSILSLTDIKYSNIPVCAFIDPGENPQCTFKYSLTKPIMMHHLFEFINGIRYKKSEIQLPATEVDIDEKQQKILVVEDNKANQFVMKKILQNIGCPMRIAENGREAINALDEESFDLIFMDCQMPVLDGIEATKIIRKSNKDYSSIPIIALTASAIEGDEKTCRDAGMDAYLAKPVRIQQIKNIISQFRPT